MKAEDLHVGDKVKYQEPDQEIVIAEVISKDDANGMLKFKDEDDFEWDELYLDIPTVVKRLINR